MVATRDYTVRRYNSAVGEIDIDIVAHSGGLAATWARTAEVGSTIWVAGPPRGIRIPDAFTWQAYIGDETALPAIARRLAKLPRSTEGVVIIEVADAREQQQLDAPEGMEVRWLLRDGKPAGTTRGIADALRRVEIPGGGGSYVWFGGEQASIKPVRAWIKAAGLGPGEFDVSGYWRRGARADQVTAGDVVHAVKHLLRLPH